MTVEFIGHNPGNRRKKETGYLTYESDKSQQHGRTGQPVNKPAKGHGLHPGTHKRDYLSGKIEAIVLVF